MLLEGQFTLLLVNAQHIKQVPGRKTDAKLRHEVVQVAVGPVQPGPNRVFCHSYLPRRAIEVIQWCEAHGTT